MISSQKLLNLNNALILIFILLALNGCTKEKQNKKYVARVNNQYLTEQELDGMINKTSENHLYRSEIIRDWINREVLYQEAVKKGILNDEDFKNIIERSRKEIAASLLLKKVFLDQKNNVNEVMAMDFYKNNIDDFKTFYNAFLVNRVTFNNEEDASRFHSQALETNWDSALSVIRQDTSLISNESKKLLYEYEIQPVSLIKIIKELLPGEVSIVVKDEMGNYEITQLLQKFDKNTILPFDLVKSKVDERFLVRQKDSLINNYIKDLYSKNEIEVKN